MTRRQDGTPPDRPVLPALAAAVPPSVPGPAAAPDAGAAPPGTATATAPPPEDGPASAGTTGAGTTGAGTTGGPARRKADPWKAGFFVLAVVAIIAGVTWALLGSKFLVVRSITVTGAPDIPRGQVLAAAGVRAGTPLIRISAGTVARRVEKLTLVESAHVSRSWPNSVTITIVERTAALAVRDPAGWDLVDRFGVVLHQVPHRPRDLPRLRTSTTPDQLRGNPAVLAAATVNRELPARLAAKVRSIAAPTADTVTLYLRGHRTVVWGDASQTAMKARELAILMRGQARYFDVSDPRAVVTAPDAPES